MSMQEGERETETEVKIAESNFAERMRGGWRLRKKTQTVILNIIFSIMSMKNGIEREVHCE